MKTLPLWDKLEMFFRIHSETDNQGELIWQFYQTLGELEQKQMLRFFGESVCLKRENEYHLPTELLVDGDRIVIYGMGKVGESFYRKLAHSSTYQLVAAVDKNWRQKNDKGFEVLPVESLKHCSYDKLLLSIADEEKAEAVRCDLIGLGVEKEKIAWAAYDDCAQLRKWCKNWCEEIPDDTSMKFFLMNTADYGNLGDQLLAIESLNFLRTYFTNIRCFEVSGYQWDWFQDELKEKIHPQDVIFIVGGGFMGDLWTKESDRVKSILQAFPKNKAVFLPQSFYYLSWESVEKDRKFFQQADNVFFIHRERFSYHSFIDKIVSNTDRNALYPDLALFRHQKRPSKERKGVVMCLRTDKEAVQKTARKRVVQYCYGLERPFHALDTLQPATMTRIDRERHILELLNEFQSAELVVTDRLHGMIFSIITSTPCIVLDNISHKIQGVYDDWLSAIPYVAFLDTDEQILTALEHPPVRRKTDMGIESLTPWFDEMAMTIHHWIMP